MDKCQLSILPIGDPDMRHVQPLDRSNKTEDIAILDSGRTFVDLLLAHNNEDVGLSPFPYRPSFELFPDGSSVVYSYPDA